MNEPLLHHNHNIESKSPKASQNLLFILQYAIASTKRSSRTFKIGLATIFIICCFVSLMLKLKQYDLYLTLRVLEKSQGDYDITLSSTKSISYNDQTLFEPSTASSFNPFLNYTSINQLLTNNTYIFGITPRWMMLTTISNPTDPLMNVSTYLLVVDSKREMMYDIGRDFPKLLLKGNEMITQVSNLYPIGISSDQSAEISMTLNLKAFLSLIVGNVSIPDSLLELTCSMSLKAV